MKRTCYKGKWKILFYPEKLIRFVNAVVKPFVYQKHRINDSSVRSFWEGWFDNILEEEASFKKTPVNIRGWFQPGFGQKVFFPKSQQKVPTNSPN